MKLRCKYIYLHLPATQPMNILEIWFNTTVRAFTFPPTFFKAKLGEMLSAFLWSFWSSKRFYVIYNSFCPCTSSVDSSLNFSFSFPSPFRFVGGFSAFRIILNNKSFWLLILYHDPHLNLNNFRASAVYKFEWQFINRLLFLICKPFAKQLATTLLL